VATRRRLRFSGFDMHLVINDQPPATETV